MRKPLIPVLLGLGLLAATARLHAQTEPSTGAAQFSDGVHPTFDAVFPEADARTVENFWRDQLRSISIKVTNKKELVGATARIPSATPDTLRILIKVEKPKGALFATAHIAFLSTEGYVAPDSPQRLREGCAAWVQQGSLTLRKQLAQKVLDDAQRELDRQQQRLEGLKRDQARAEDGIRKAADRSERATADKAKAEQELAAMAADTTASLDSLAAIKAAKVRTKEEARLRDRIKRAGSTVENAKKKTEDLQWALKKNAEDQVAQQQAVERQQAEVKKRREELEAIH
jgi:hypothetical protein